MKYFLYSVVIQFACSMLFAQSVEFNDSETIMKHLYKSQNGSNLPFFKICYGDQCVRKGAEAIDVVRKAYDPNKDVDASGKKQGAHYMEYNKYRAAITFLSTMSGSKEAENALLSLISSTEAQLKKVQEKKLDFGAYPNQRLTYIRSEAIRALGYIGNLSTLSISILKRISKEKKNPYGIYDMYNGYHAQNTAREALKINSLNRFSGASDRNYSRGSN